MSKYTYEFFGPNFCNLNGAGCLTKSLISGYLGTGGFRTFFGTGNRARDLPSVGAVGFSMFRSVGLTIALNPKAHVNLLAWALGTCRDGLV